VVNAPEDSSEIERFRQLVRTGDPDIRAELITDHLELARRLARRFAHRSESLDDLEQVASIGLIKAVEGFDPELGFAFSAYATRTILGELKRHFRDRGWSVRAPRRVQELYLHLGQTTEDLAHSLGRAPTLTEIATAADASEEEVLEALEAGRGYRSASLDEPGADGGTPQDRLGREDPDYAHAEDRTVLLPVMATLPERERTILHMRFVEDLTQSEIAERVGISQMHVSRLLARSLQQLRSAFETGDAPGPAAT